MPFCDNLVQLEAKSLMTTKYNTAMCSAGHTYKLHESTVLVLDFFLKTYIVGITMHKSQFF